MKRVMLAAAALSLLPALAACENGRDDWGFHRGPPPANWYADDHYQPRRNYRPNRLQRDDYIYRGYRDGRYYCRRDDGTAGLIIGGISGAILGSHIARGESRTIGAILGAMAGGAIGHAIDEDNVRCR